MPRRKLPELDPTIILEAIGGSQAGFLRLYHHYADKVRYAVARAAQRAGHVRNIDELCQEVWCRLLDNERRLLRRYDPSRGGFESFVSTVAYQQATVAIGRYQRQVPHVEPEVGDEELADDGASQFAEDLIQSELFHKLLDRVDAELDDDERLLLREVHLEQRTCRSVAAQLGVSENAIYKRSERLKKKLAHMAEELLRTSLPPGSSPPSLALMTGLVAAALAMPTASNDWGAAAPAQARSHFVGADRLLA
jgi:RNA polymerase sigma factor (sigma-70 family)